VAAWDYIQAYFGRVKLEIHIRPSSCMKERFAVLAESCKSFPQSLSISDIELINKLPSVQHEKLNELTIKGLNIQ
jgi:hypothetical protein